jgi:putative tryptophan/tyrosine transport system substrate-binding protein
MDRRAFLGGIGHCCVAPRVICFIGALAGLIIPFHTDAAETARKVSRVGFLSAASAEPFRAALRDLGYIEGENLALEVRLAAGRLDLLPALAAELVEARVDVIAAASPPAIQAAKDATATIPIVMAVTSVDPVHSGFVRSLARPGGNITGVAMMADQIAGKRLAMLREMLPRATRIAVLSQIDHAASVSQVKAARNTAQSLGIELHVVEVRDSRDYENAFTNAARYAQGLFVVANPTFYDDRQLLAGLATKHRLPMLCEWREMAAAGCLMAYGPNLTELHRRVAMYVDQILRGLRPGDLPVEQPTKFDLTINLDTAKALGVAVPQSLMLHVTP